jgi:leader peptidase (prepilin peptidase)/N-methyltransferase
MNDWTWATGGVMALWGFVAGLLVPTLISRIPEPAPEDPITAEEEGESPVEQGDPKELYADIARLPRLRLGSAIASALIAGIVGAHLGWTWASVAWGFLVPVGVALAVVDWRTRLLPTRVIAPSYVVLLAVLSVATLVESDIDPLIRAGWGWLIAGGTYLLLWFIYPKGMGYGDVRLSGVLGLALGYVGWGEMFTGTYAGFLLGGIGGALLSGLRIVDKKAYPFGPFMLVGALLGVLVGGDVAAWYTA